MLNAIRSNLKISESIFYIGFLDQIKMVGRENIKKNYFNINFFKLIYLTISTFEDWVLIEKSSFRNMLIDNSQVISLMLRKAKI